MPDIRDILRGGLQGFQSSLPFLLLGGQQGEQLIDAPGAQNLTGPATQGLPPTLQPQDPFISQLLPLIQQNPDLLRLLPGPRG